MNNLAGYSIPGLQFFFFQYFEYIIPLSLCYKVSSKKSIDSFIGVVGESLVGDESLPVFKILLFLAI